MKRPFHKTKFFIGVIPGRARIYPSIFLKVDHKKNKNGETLIKKVCRNAKQIQTFFFIQEKKVATGVLAVVANFQSRSTRGAKKRNKKKRKAKTVLQSVTHTHTHKLSPTRPEQQHKTSLQQFIIQNINKQRERSRGAKNITHGNEDQLSKEEL